MFYNQRKREKKLTHFSHWKLKRKTFFVILSLIFVFLWTNSMRRMICHMQAMQFCLFSTAESVSLQELTGYFVYDCYSTFQSDTALVYDQHYTGLITLNFECMTLMWWSYSLEIFLYSYILLCLILQPISWFKLLKYLCFRLCVYINFGYSFW